MTIRPVVAMLAAPLIIPVVVALCVLLVPGIPFTFVGSRSWQFRLREGLSLGVFATMIGYVVTVAGGLPVHTRLQRQGQVRWKAYAAVGAILGALPSLLFAVFVYVVDFSTRDYPPGVAASLMLIGMACGTAVALLFWLIAARQWRPSAYRA